MVPTNDRFGILDMLVRSTLCGSEKWEMAASLAYNHALSEVVKSSTLVREKDTATTTECLNGMRRGVTTELEEEEEVKRLASKKCLGALAPHRQKRK